MCISFGAFNIQTKLDHAQHISKISSNTFLGRYIKKQGKTLFETKYILTSGKWYKTPMQSSVINLPAKISFDSIYILNVKTYPITPDYLNTQQMVFSNYSKNKFFRIYIREYLTIKSQHNRSQELEQIMNKQIESSFENLSTAYLKGILFGDKSQLKNYKAIQHIGLAHLFAASGYHVGILFGIVFLLFKVLPRFKNKTTIELVIALILVWLYASLLHFSPSILRASLLFTIISFLKILKKQFSMIELLSLIGIGMVIYNPFIIYEISFQLSFTAVYSILLFFPILRKLYSRVPNRILTLPLDLLNVSFSAQLLTLPLTIYHFNQFPTYSLIGNLAVAPLISIVIPISLLCLSFKGIGVPHLYFTKLVDSIFRLVDFLITELNTLPHKTINPLFLDSKEVVLILLILLTVITLLMNHKKAPIFKVGILIIFTSIYNTMFWNSNLKTNNRTLVLVPLHRGYNIYFIKNSSLFTFEKIPNNFIKSRISKQQHLYYTTENLIKNDRFNLTLDNTHLELKHDTLKIWENNKIQLNTSKKLTSITCLDWDNKSKSWVSN